MGKLDYNQNAIINQLSDLEQNISLLRNLNEQIFKMRVGHLPKISTIFLYACSIIV